MQEPIEELKAGFQVLGQVKLLLALQLLFQVGSVNLERLCMKNITSEEEKSSTKNINVESKSMKKIKSEEKSVHLSFMVDNLVQ